MAVFKLRRPKAQWSSPEVPSFYDTYYMKIRVDGKQVLMNTKSTDKAMAERIESAAVRKARVDGAAALLAALETHKGRQTGATVGEVIAAYLAEGVRINKKEEYAKRNVNGLRRVCAFARDFWRVNTGGIKGVKIGAMVADEEKVDAMKVSELTAELRESYFRAAQGGKLDWNEPQEGNVTINSTLAQASDVFSKDAMYHKLKHLNLPDLTGFRTGPWLPEEDAQPDPLNVAQFEAMLKAAELLKTTDWQLWVVNVLLRQTALRSAYAVALHRSWLVKHGKDWFLEVRNRQEVRAEKKLDDKDAPKILVPAFRKKRGTRDQLIPLSRTLAAALLRNRRQGDYLILPEGKDTAREALVKDKHNAWLKAIIGGAGEMTQGNHRLRDTVASILWSIDKPTAAQEALGHASVDTTAKHYGKKIHVSPAMRAEMGAWTA